MLSRAFVVACIATLAFANPIARSMTVHETRAGLPLGFVQNGAADKDTVLTLRAGLVPNNVTGLEDELYAVSTPGSARYGQHLSKEEVEQYMKPSSESVTLVNHWLNEHGLAAKTISPAGDWVEFSVPVGKANELLDADFQVFAHTESGQESVRTMSYSIPTDLKGHLDLVHPTISLATPFAMPAIASSKKAISTNATSDGFGSSCDSAITPACLQELYGIPTTQATQASNGLAVSGFIEQYANEDDLESFLENFRNDVPASTSFTLQTLDGGVNPQDPNSAGLEANLDIQYTVGIATDVPVSFVSVGETSNGGDFTTALLDLTNSLLSEDSLPHVLTTSYGQNENTVSSSAAKSVCNAFMQLGARGTTVLFASGDGGVAGIHGVSCTTFVPVFPGGCPFLTSVGGTTGMTETAASFSSGGFSNIFSQPSYQSSAVSSYLSKLGRTNSGRYNAKGRGFPDVSAQGENFQVVVGGQLESVGGTSASSPTFASIVALLNDELVGAGKSPLGFLNPLLYSSPSALNDITSGNNPGCGTNGFPAKAGWDPVTGLGTPDYARLKAAAGI